MPSKLLSLALVTCFKLVQSLAFLGKAWKEQVPLVYLAPFFLLLAILSQSTGDGKLEMEQDLLRKVGFLPKIGAEILVHSFALFEFCKFCTFCKHVNYPHFEVLHSSYLTDLTGIPQCIFL